MQKTQNIPKVASKATAIVVALILAFAFVFQIGYYFGGKSVSPEDNMSGGEEASPPKIKQKVTIQKFEPIISGKEPEENTRKPEYVEKTKQTPYKTEMPEPTVISQEQYTVQVGAFRYISNAERVKELIKSRGYTVWINPPAEDSSLNKVRVGRFYSKNRAQSFGEEIIAFTTRELENMGYPIKREYRVMLIQ